MRHIQFFLDQPLPHRHTRSQATIDRPLPYRIAVPLVLTASLILWTLIWQSCSLALHLLAG
jgi:hypothetical protein